MKMTSYERPPTSAAAKPTSFAAITTYEPEKRREGDTRERGPICKFGSLGWNLDVYVMEDNRDNKMNS